MHAYWRWIEDFVWHNFILIVITHFASCFIFTIWYYSFINFSSYEALIFDYSHQDLKELVQYHRQSNLILDLFTINFDSYALIFVFDYCRRDLTKLVQDFTCHYQGCWITNWFIVINSSCYYRQKGCDSFKLDEELLLSYRFDSRYFVKLEGFLVEECWHCSLQEKRALDSLYPPHQIQSVSLAGQNLYHHLVSFDCNQHIDDFIKYHFNYQVNALS